MPTIKVKSEKEKVKSDKLKSDKEKVNIDKSIKKCENTFCKEYFKKQIQLSKDLIKMMKNKSMKMKIKDKNKKEKINLLLKESQEKLKSKKFKEDSLKECKNGFCNPGCKGTIFQNGKFPKELVNKYSKEKHGNVTIKFLKSLRESLFKDKKSILKNDFYEEFKNKDKLKKKGAVSGCAIASLL